MTGVGEGDGVGVGVADGAGDGAGTGDGVGVGDAVGVGVGVGLDGALLPLLLAGLDELPPPHPTDPNNIHARTATAAYLNIGHLFELGKSDAAELLPDV